MTATRQLLQTQTYEVTVVRLMAGESSSADCDMQNHYLQVLNGKGVLEVTEQAPVFFQTGNQTRLQHGTRYRLEAITPMDVLVTTIGWHGR